MTDTSIVLLAIGKRGYGYAAHNLALSLKHYGCSYPIILYAQPETIDNIDQSLFDKVELLNEKYYTLHGRFQPGYAKANVLAEMPTPNVLYIDADTLCLKSIDPLVQSLKESKKEFASIWMGEGEYGNKGISYDAWSKHEYAYPFFDLDTDKKWITVQSSLMWLKKTDFTRVVMYDLKTYFEKGYSYEGLKEAWGKKFLPDELFLSGVISKYNIDIKLGFEPMFFAAKNNKDISLDYFKIIEKYYFLAMYGGGGLRSLTLQRFQDWYSRVGEVIGKKEGKRFFNHKYIMNDKILST